jgi:copper chaperone CopZ
MLVVGKAFGKRTLAAYLFSIAFGAMFFGFIVDTFFMDTFLSAMLPQGAAECHGHGALGVFDYICAGLLAVFIIYAKLVHKGCDGHCGCGCGDSHCGCEDHDEDHDHCCCGEHEHHDEHHTEPKSKTYKVFGMTCSHCKACVEKAAFALDGVAFAVANVSKKELVIEGSVDEAALKTAIEEAGFEFGGEA